MLGDLDVISKSPYIMAAWGYGDLVGKLVAGIDWIVADALGEEAVNQGPLAMGQDNLASWPADPAGWPPGSGEDHRSPSGSDEDACLAIGVAADPVRRHGRARDQAAVSRHRPPRPVPPPPPPPRAAPHAPPRRALEPPAAPERLQRAV